MNEDSWKRKDEIIYKQEQKVIHDLTDMGVPENIAEGIAYDATDLARDVSDGIVIDDASIMVQEHSTKYKGHVVDPVTGYGNDETYMDGSEIDPDGDDEDDFDPEDDNPPFEKPYNDISASADSAADGGLDDVVGPSNADLEAIEAEIDDGEIEDLVEDKNGVFHIVKDNEDNKHTLKLAA